jgi:hypothetical protein
MGLIGRILSTTGRGAATALGDTASDLVEVFRPNATREMELAHDAVAAAQQGFAAEFAHGGDTWFDRGVNGLNRLPRPAMALGAVGLFAFAMADPDSFAIRMQGLAEIPDPLWWLLGAVVSFYFGARELHYFRSGQARRDTAAQPPRGAGAAPGDAAARFADNAALADWARGRGS